MNITRPVLRFHGGKWRLAPWIIAHLPPHRCYVEPFGGGASVLMRKARSYAEVYNDLAGDVVNVFRVLRDPEQSARLEHLARLTPFARDEFNECTASVINAIDDPVERARLTVFRSLAGFGSASSNPKHATGFRANSNRSGSTPAHDWMNWPDNIRAWTERLRGVVIENRDAIAVMTQHDAITTLHYVDPPYVHSTRMRAAAKGKSLYVHEMTDDQHRELLTFLRGLRGMVVLSGYRCDLYDDMLVDWQRVDRMSFADGARDRVESLWLSPNCAVTQMCISEVSA